MLYFFYRNWINLKYEFIDFIHTIRIAKYKDTTLITYSCIIIVMGYYFYLVYKIALYLFWFHFIHCFIYVHCMRRYYNVKYFIFINYEFDLSFLNALKYYMYNIPVYFTYFIFYYFFKIYLKKNFKNFFNNIKIHDVILFLFIMCFVYLYFFFKVINKVFRRQINCTYDYEFIIRLFFMNFKSMYIFDFEKSIYYEHLYIHFKWQKPYCLFFCNYYIINNKKSLKILNQTGYYFTLKKIDYLYKYLIDDTVVADMNNFDILKNTISLVVMFRRIFNGRTYNIFDPKLFGVIKHVKLSHGSIKIKNDLLYHFFSNVFYQFELYNNTYFLENLNSYYMLR